MKATCQSASRVKMVRVFISYTHDSEAHQDDLLTVADRLNKQGVDAHIDRYEESPSEGWFRWMENQVEAADFVLVVCTEQYLRRFRAQEGPGKGLGGVWEGAVITALLYNQGGKNTKFIPVVTTLEDRAHIPAILQGATWYNIKSSEGYERLYRRLTEQPFYVKPDLGNIIAMPTRLLDNSNDRAIDTPSPERISEFRPLLLEITRLLDQNRVIFDAFGPGSKAATGSPLTNAADIWNSRKLDTVIPNNDRIMRLIESNPSYFTRDEYGVFLKFHAHATAFAENQINRRSGDVVPTFPIEFREMIERLFQDVERHAKEG